MYMHACVCKTMRMCVLGVCVYMWGMYICICGGVCYFMCTLCVSAYVGYAYVCVCGISAIIYACGVCICVFMLGG